MKQSDTFVLDKCEITLDKKIYFQHEVDLHNMRKSKSVTLWSALPYLMYIQFNTTITNYIISQLNKSLKRNYLKNMCAFCILII